MYIHVAFNILRKKMAEQKKKRKQDRQEQQLVLTSRRKQNEIKSELANHNYLQAV